MPTHNICHVELPLLAPFDEETPTESKVRSNLGIGPKRASKHCFFLCFHTILSSSTTYHVYIIIKKQNKKKT